jgi:hypothetical protein
MVIGPSLTTNWSISSNNVPASVAPPTSQMSLPGSCFSSRTFATGSVSTTSTCSEAPSVRENTRCRRCGYASGTPTFNPIS